MGERLLSKFGIFTKSDKDDLLQDIQKLIEELKETVKEKHSQQNKAVVYLDDHLSRSMNQIYAKFSSLQNEMNKNDIAMQDIYRQIDEGNSCLGESVSDGLNQTHEMFSAIKVRMDKNDIEMQKVHQQIEDGVCILKTESKEIHNITKAIQRQQGEFNEAINKIMLAIHTQLHEVIDDNQKIISNINHSNQEISTIIEKQTDLMQKMDNIQVLLKQSVSKNDFRNVEELLKMLVLNQFVDDVENEIKKKLGS